LTNFKKPIFIEQFLVLQLFSIFKEHISTKFQELLVNPLGVLTVPKLVMT